MARRGRLVTAVSIAAAVLLGASGCSLVREMMQPTTTLAENLRYQRISAEKFISNWPQVDAITFTRDGSFDGSGEWTTNAVVTCDGRTYQEIVGPSETIGDDLPDAPPNHAPGPVTVIYSDGSSEVLR